MKTHTDIEPKPDSGFFCPFVAVEKAEATGEMTASRMLGILIQRLQEQYAYTHQASLRHSVAKEGRTPGNPDEPMVLESLIALLDADQRTEKDRLIKAMDHEPISSIHERQKDIKALEKLSAILKEALTFEKEEAGYDEEDETQAEA